MDFRIALFTGPLAGELQVSLAGLSASNSTRVSASGQGGLAQVELRGLDLTFQSSFTVPLGGERRRVSQP